MAREDQQHVQLADDVAEYISEGTEISVERVNTPEAQIMDVEYEGDTYRIRTHPRGESPSRASIKEVVGDEEKYVGDVYESRERELADELYREITGHNIYEKSKNIAQYAEYVLGQDDFSHS
jgi:hypothetical protein